MLPAAALAQNARGLSLEIQRKVIEAGRDGATGGVLAGAGLGLGFGAQYGGWLGAAYGTVFGAVGGGAFGYLAADSWARNRLIPKSERDLMPTMKVPPAPQDKK